MVNFIKFGEAFSMVIPSQAFLNFGFDRKV